jgi:hypothetical protein
MKLFDGLEEVLDFGGRQIAGSFFQNAFDGIANVVDVNEEKLHGNRLTHKKAPRGGAYQSHPTSSHGYLGALGSVLASVVARAPSPAWV